MREVLKVRPGGAYEVLRAHHPQTQLVMDNLAALLRAQGRYDEALKLRVLNSELSVRSRVSVKKQKSEIYHRRFALAQLDTSLANESCKFACCKF